MSIFNLLRTGLVAATVTFATISAASAFPAVATSQVNVRTGPATSYARVDTLQPGENVDVRECQSGWCFVDHNGPDGWVSASYLSQLGQRSGGDIPRGGPNYGDRGYGDRGYGGNYGWHGDFGNPNGGFSFGFSFGNAHRPPHRQPRVCFYDGRNFSGASFCATPGTNYRFLGGWSDRISSVRVFDGASATLCQGNGYHGFCRAVTSNTPALGPFLNNRVSSLQVD